MGEQNQEFMIMRRCRGTTLKPMEISKCHWKISLIKICNKDMNQEKIRIGSKFSNMDASDKNKIKST